MAQAVTEIVVLILKPDLEIEQPIRDFLRIVSRQPGFQCAFWGRFVENPDNLQLLIGLSIPRAVCSFLSNTTDCVQLTDWDDVESHIRFTQSQADFDAAGALLGPLLAGAPCAHHAQFSGSLTEKLLTSPKVELATVYCTSKAGEERLSELLEVLEKGDKCCATALGTVLEKIPSKKTGANQSAIMAAVGWESVEAHFDALKTDAVSKITTRMADVTEDMEVHHVTLETYP